MTKESFIEKAEKIHKGKYDYSKITDIKNKREKVCIICPEHGEFWQQANDHLNGHGCRACCGLKKMTNEEFINKAILKHGDKYDYSEADYVNNHTKITIICPEHGKFRQVPNSHLSGCGCPKCGGCYNLSTDDFIKKAIKKHGNKYDYSKVEYDNSHKKVCIICPKHGEFWQQPNGHLNGYGCPKCGNQKCRDKNLSCNEEFIKKAANIHKDKYDYSKVKYIDSKTKVCIICPEHGEFFMAPANHLNGQGCRKCSNEKLSKERTKPTKVWIEEAKKIHDNRYSYERTLYQGHRKKVIITCPIHGDFEQFAYDHIQGKGCPKCRRSWMENDVEKFLKENNLNYVYQYRPKFLIEGKSHFSLDFFLPDYGIAIECHGAQHFNNSKFYGKNFEENVKRDKRKKQLCDENNVKILYYTNIPGKLEYFETVIRDKTELLNKIKNG